MSAGSPDRLKRGGEGSTGCSARGLTLEVSELILGWGTRSPSSLTCVLSPELGLHPNQDITSALLISRACLISKQVFIYLSIHLFVLAPLSGTASSSDGETIPGLLPIFPLSQP